MAALAILGQKQIVGLGGRNYVITQVQHDGGTNTVSVDQTASQARAYPVNGQTSPTVTLGTATTDPTSASYAMVDVTLTGGGSGVVDVVTAHGAAVGSSKA